MGALAPRGPLAGTFRDVYSTIARLADAAGVPLFVVGGYSSLRPAPGAFSYSRDRSRTFRRLGSLLVEAERPRLRSSTSAAR